jgi:ABC-type transport system substrate-binding protein
VAVIASATALAGCSGNQGVSGESTPAAQREENAPPAADVKQEITLGAMEDFKTGAATNGTSLVFDMLTALEPGNTPVPNLVSSWELTNENKTYVLEIVPNVVFTNGEKLTASVVQDAMEYWAPYKNAGYMYALESFNAVDDNTLEVNLRQPYSALPNELASIPATLPGGVDDKGNITEWIGTGPFIIEGYTANQSATLTRNDNYWNKDKKPGLERVTWTVIPDENARVLALQGGQADAIGATEHHLSIAYNTVPQLESDARLNVIRQETGGMNVIYVYNYLKGAMSDINLRKAVTHAIDRETLAKRVLHGVPAATGHLLQTDNRYSPKKETEYTFDLSAARQYLADAGYSDSDGDGVADKNGAPLSLVLLTQTGENYSTDAVFVQECLKTIGIHVEIVTLEMNSFYERASKGEFDLCFTHPWLTFPLTYLNWRGMSEGYDVFGTTFAVDPNIPALAGQISAAIDENELEGLWERVWSLEYDAYSATPLYTNVRVIASQKNVGGFQFNTDPMVIDLSQVAVN